MQTIRRTITTLAGASFAAFVLIACGGGEAPPVDTNDDPGVLSVAIAGLPDGVDGNVNVSGAGGFADTLTASETFLVPAGTYAISAASITHEGVPYAASVSSAAVTVPSGGVGASTVTYAAGDAAPGTLQVNVGGLPDGADADVQVTRSGGFQASLTATSTLSDVEPGTYAVSAQDVTVGDDVYGASVSGSPATVPTGGTATATVTYTFLDPTTVGTLQVDIGGLAGPANVTITGPGGFTESITQTTTLSDLIPGNYIVSATNVTEGSTTFAPIIDGSPALVLPEETTTVDVTYVQFAANDGDAASNPGLFVQFRATSPGPVWVEGARFNAGARIDTKGIQYRNELSRPGDPSDWLDFRLVHGQSPTTSIKVDLECSINESPSPVRVQIRDSSGNKVGNSTSCGGSRTISVPNVGGSGIYLVGIETFGIDPFYASYVLSIDAYCFQGCTFEPFDP
ncbi:MAG: hypothetical protein H0U69_11040 [Trueperaceae bacterium]|nr:hypothetical protein [Trueperaceae bacterium]